MRFISKIKEGALHLLPSVAALALIVGVGMALPQTASANTAANATIKNTVTVSYNDAGGNNYTAEDIVLVDVTLVSAAPTIDAPADQYASVGSTAVYTYTVTNNSNGLDTITPSATVSLSNVTGATVSTSGAVPLGGTTLSGNQTINMNATPFTITVPNDNYSANSADSILNGIANGDTVVIDGYTFTVTTAPVDTYGALTGTIGLTATAATQAIVGAANYTGTNGTQVGEQSTFTVTVDLTAAVVTDPTQAATVTTTTKATASGGGFVTDDTITYIKKPHITIAKRVRNVTTSGSTGGTDTYTFAANSYAGSGTTGKPGEILEYLVIAENVGDAYAEAVTIADAVPKFTDLYAFAAASYGTGGNTTAGATKVFAKVFDENGTAIGEVTMQNTDVEVAAKLAGDAGAGTPATTAGTALNFYLGNGTGATLTAGSGGQVTWTGAGTGNKFYIIYQVVIQ